ncbi:MAG TPA: MoxR family ATPase [Planctomycetota bacterium]|nr:MoxR family ATPase [Planctomycetota bacterium]
MIVGQDAAIEQLLVALLCEGHVLIEGVPGTAKTLMVRALALALDLRFKRVQFTPDLMPADIVGTSVFDLQSNQFRVQKGPIFTDLLLGDEINRAPAKTQSALLEAMEERRATIDGVGHEVGAYFTVFATQNPVEFEGTYPLPEAQLDRFLLKLNVTYPEPEEEERILKGFHEGFDPRHLERQGVRAVANAEDLLAIRAAVRRVECEDGIIRYIRDIVGATRKSQKIALGGGPRASINLLLSSKALAVLRGRGFVTPDDVKAMAKPVLRHRIVLEPEAELEGLERDQAIEQVLGSVAVPR